MIHLREHHKPEREKKETIYICDTCGKNFSSLGSLKRHVKKIHENMPKILVCDKCEGGKTFETRTELGKHMRKVHKIGKEKNCVCSVCGKAYLEMAFLREHMYSHADEPQFPCEKCSKKFWGRRQLYHHDMSIHEGRRDHICTYCGKGFHTKSRLLRHSTVVSIPNYFFMIYELYTVGYFQKYFILLSFTAS